MLILTPGYNKKIKLTIDCDACLVFIYNFSVIFVNIHKMEPEMPINNKYLVNIKIGSILFPGRIVSCHTDK